MVPIPGITALNIKGNLLMESNLAMVPIQMKLELLFRVSGKMVYVKEKVN
jgi:hypothetical protein